jgi:hypothetical protein
MINKFFNIISKINQLFFFLVLLGFTIFVIKPILPFLTNKSEPAVKIEANVEKTEQSTPKLEENVYSKIFHDKIKDVYIFKVTAKISSNSTDHKKKDRRSSASYSRGYNNSKIVNILFVKEQGESHKLLDKNRLILATTYTQDGKDDTSGHFILDKNLYSIVETDSNQDGFLTAEDEKNLYISDYNGTNMHLIMKNFINYSLTDDNEILIAKDNDEYTIYNTKSRKISQLIKQTE